MRVTKEGDVLSLSLNLFEGRILRQALLAIRQNYRVPPGEADSKMRGVWYAEEGCRRAGMSAEETEEWQRHLHGFRSDNLKLLERWCEEMARRRGGRYQVSLSAEEASSFLTVVNDHRLLLAARHDIGQREMDCHSLREISRLPPAQQAALYEIHVLAYLMEELIRWLSEFPGQ